MSQQVNINVELKDATDGALRVSRRKVLYALEKMIQVHERLDFDDDDDVKKIGRDTSFASMNRNVIMDLDAIASTMESELNRREAEYRSREEVME